MFIPSDSILLRAASLAFLLLLAGCAGTPKAPVVEETLPPLAREAEQALAAGEPARAAETWLQAARLHPERAGEFLLRAASAWIEAGDLPRAKETLTLLDRITLAEPRIAKRRLLEGRIALMEHEPETAIERLDFDPALLSPEDRAEYHRLRARAYLETGNYLESARERVALDDLLPEGKERIENEFALWEALNHLSTRALELLETPDELGGWIALTRILRIHAADPEALEAALEDWRYRWPEHPAGRDFLARLQERRKQIVTHRPEHVVVMLPLSGRLARAGKAIQEGVIAAYYQMIRDGAPLVVEFRDTQGDPNRVWSLYHAAREEGADFVIGPLHRDAVTMLARAGELPLPVLALNRAVFANEDTPLALPAGFYQFPLAPEDEALAIAEHALQRGFKRSLALLPEGRLGDRMLDAYLAHWADTDGARQLLEAEAYPPEPRKLSGVVSRLLNIDSSKRRYQALVRTLGVRPKFEPRPRKDADHVFLVANPVMGRLLKPLLRFHRASRLPVLATSSIYSGHPAPERDRDLDGIEFCDIPWVIDPTPEMKHARGLLEDGQRVPGPLLRLTALGYDALTVAPLLPALQAGLLPSHAGATGQLTLDEQARLHRGLAWARMENGVPHALHPLNPVEDAQGGAVDDVSQTLSRSRAGPTGRGPGLPLPDSAGAEAPRPQLPQPVRRD